MDERAKKRKLEEIQDSEESDVEGVEKEQPRKGLKEPQENKKKKQKTSDSLEITDIVNDLDKGKDTASQAEIKRQKKALKKVKKAEKERAKLERRAQKSEQSHHGMEALSNNTARGHGQDKAHKKQAKSDVAGAALAAEDEDHPMKQAADEDSMGLHVEEVSMNGLAPFEADGLLDETASKTSDQISTSNPPSPSPTPIFDTTYPANGTLSTSTTTSISSTIPPSTAPISKIPKVPSIPPEVLRARLAARIDILRAARKADNPDGTPVRNRQELMEARRRKEEQRQKHKREMRLKAKQAEEEERERRLERSRASVSARESPASFMSGDGERLAFGRVRWGDGSEVKSDGKGISDGKKMKGPKGGDVLGSLKQFEKKKERIEGMDEGKRKDVEEKELWSIARKRVAGEKVKDDGALLRKALKRKEKDKKKSEREWGERIEGVEKGKEARQRKRETNLKKRREEKGGKSKKSGAGGGGGKKKKIKSRPGFEGSFGSGRRK